MEVVRLPGILTASPANGFDENNEVDTGRRP
jgi:hypothetical protein